MDRGQRTREKILDAAAACFAERGYAGTTVRVICAAARVNVAAVSYFFGSKERLYIEAVGRIFERTTAPVLPLVDTVRDDATWRAALLSWTSLMLTVILAGRPPEVWAARLFAMERVNPSPALPAIYAKYMIAVQRELRRLIRMAFTRDPGEVVVQDWANSIASQVLSYAFRAPPWDRILGLPKRREMKAWIRRKSELIAGGVTSRLRFRRFIPAGEESR